MVKKAGKKVKESPAASAAAAAAAAGGGASASSRPSTPSNEPPSAGYLVSCDIPTKNFICYLNDLKAVDKRFIIEDLDATHVLIKHNAKNEILDAVEKWGDSNVFSSVETVGENLDMS